NEGWRAKDNKTRIDAVKDELIRLIENLANIKFQVIAFSDKEKDDLLFESGPQPSTQKNKSIAIKWISELSVGGGTKPMKSLFAAIDNQHIQQIVLLSDGEPSRVGYSRRSLRDCSITNSIETIRNCVSIYNDLKSGELNKSKVRIDTISIEDEMCQHKGRPWEKCFKKQYCESAYNPFEYKWTRNYWMGKLSSDNGGKCTILK
ncbi:MAG: hypothetical protein CMD04_00580, partial [Flavobacteriales bacterium]|nr:hypothetical protein [Flavobacteriales bacterium]